MEMNADMIQTYLCPEGVSLADGEIDGYPVVLSGTMRREDGTERKAWGNVRWHTYSPDQIGKYSIAGENQRDVHVSLMTIKEGSEWQEDDDGPQAAMHIAFDYDYIRKLISRDAGAEEDLVQLVSQKAGLCGFHRCERG